MANDEQDLISHYIERTTISSDTNYLLNELKRVAEAFDKLEARKINISTAKGTKESLTAIKEAEKANQELVKSKQKLIDVELKYAESLRASAEAEKNRRGVPKPTGPTNVNDAAEKERLRQQNELINASVRLTAAETQEAKATAIVKKELQQKNAELKNTVREETAAKGSIEQLRASLIRFQNQYDRLSSRDRNSSIGLQLQKAITDTSTHLKTLEGQTGRFQRNVGNYQSALGGLTGGIDDLASAYLGLISIQTLFDFLGSSVRGFNEAEDVVNRFKNTLENVGRTDVLEDLTQEARRLAAEFKTIDDEDVIDVFDKLITYGKLTENQIRQLTPVIINFAAKQKISLADSAGVIIKALEGNARALKDYGIELKASSSTAEAFGIVMNDLAPKVEGAAKAFGETTRGQIEATRVEIENLKEDIGEKLQPAIKSFYSILSDGLKGIPQIFESIIFTVKATIASLTTVFELAKAGVTLDFDEIDRIKARIKLAKDRAEAEKEYANTKIAAQTFANSVINKSEEEQNKILQQNILLRDASVKSYKLLFDAGKQMTAEGRRAAAAMIKDIETVNRLEAVMAKAKDKRVLGTGGSDEDDQTQIKSVDKKFYDAELRRKADALKQLSDVESSYYRERLNNRAESYEKEVQIIEGFRAVEIGNAANRLNDVKNKRDATANEIINATNEFNAKVEDINRSADEKLLKQEDAFNSDVLRIRQSGKKQQLDRERADNQLFIDAAKERYEKQTDAILAAQLKSMANVAAAKDQEIEALNKDYVKQLAAAGTNLKKRELIEKDYAKRRADIEFQAAATILKIEIATAEKILALRRSQNPTGDFSQQEQALSEAKMALSDLETKHIVANNEKQSQSHKDSVGEVVELINSIRKYSDIVLNLIGGALDASATKEKNRLQDQADLLDRNTQKEIEAVNASVLAADEKADKISVINARAQAQKDRIAFQQKQIDLRKAQFDKAKAIADIILATAVAVAKAGNPFLAAVAAAIGAAQLAIAAATPIPRYKEGTKDQTHPGGLAVLGDGYKKEFVILPDGKGFVSANKPTVYDLPKHTQVMPDADVFLNSVMNNAYKNIASSPAIDDRIDYGTDFILKKLDGVKTAIVNKRENYIQLQNGEFRKMIKRGNNKTTFINKSVYE